MKKFVVDSNKMKGECSNIQCLVTIVSHLIGLLDESTLTRIEDLAMNAVV